MNTKQWILSPVALLCVALAAPLSATENEAMEATSDRQPVVLYGEPVDRVYAPTIHSWQAVDGQRLLLYVTAFRPYLVTLNRKVNALKWEHKIGFDNRTSYIDARFDRVYVDGFPYSIARIEKLSRETARALLGRDEPAEADEPAEQDEAAEPETVSD